MKKYLYFFFAMVIFASCADDETPETTDENENKEKTKTELVTEGKWRMNEGTIEPSVEVEVLGNKVVVNTYWDLLAAVNGGLVPDCDKDNEMLLYTDSSVVLDEGPTKCDPLDPDSEPGGDWEFNIDETEITFSSFPFDPLSEPRTLEITELSETNFNMIMDYTFVNPLDNSTSEHKIVLNYVNTNQ